MKHGIDTKQCNGINSVCPPCRFFILGMEHPRAFTKSSSHACFREGKCLAVNSGSHPGHHHCDELSGCAAGRRVCRPAALLHLLLQWPVIQELHHTGELQLWAVRRHQAKGDQPATLLLRGLRSCSSCFGLPTAQSQTVNEPHFPANGPPATQSRSLICQYDSQVLPVDCGENINTYQLNAYPPPPKKNIELHF